MNPRSSGAWAGVVAVIAGCGGERWEGAGGPRDESVALTSSPGARARVEALRERFPAAFRASTVGRGIAAGFETSRDDGVRVLIPSDAKRGIARTASVELPHRATGFARLEDDASRLSVRFALKDANDSPLAVANGMALYSGALAGADVVHRPRAEGNEDFVIFEEQPAREHLRYAVDVTRVAGLRLVSNTLEFLDDTGTPRLRVAPPYVVDAAGKRHAAKLAVEECAYDVDPAGPWGRRLTRPGAAECGVLVTWTSVTYPAVVDPAWTTTGSMAVGRSHHTASVLASGRVLVASGWGATAELYDPGTGTFSMTGSLAQARQQHSASVLASGNVLIAGGQVQGSPDFLATAELYDPVAGTFSPTGSMAEARYNHTASVLGSGKVLVAGGAPKVNCYECFDALATAELYDPAAGTFSVTGSMAQERREHTAGVLGSGKVLVAGGTVLPAAAELYDPGAGTFSVTGKMLEVRFGHAASVLGSGRVLVAGGWAFGSPGVLATAELYDPVGGTFSTIGSMVEARREHTASMLASGKVLLAGGMNATGLWLATAELYDPAAGTFSTTGSTADARHNHTATVLTSGKVLVAGGGPDGFGWNLWTAELYDPASGPGGSGAGGSSSGGSGTGGANSGGSATGGSNTGGTGTAGTAGSPAGGTAGSGGSQASADSGDDTGCGCATAPTPITNSFLASLGLLLMSLSRRREQTRRQGGSR